MIPKIIHYCWFGHNPKPELIEKCIASWREHCPDYEIIEWNEDNFDVNQIAYTEKAYADRKWAFVSDYARLKIICDHGGIYLDTDVLLKNRKIDALRQYKCWLASDDVRYVSTGLGFGAEAGHPLIKALLDAYLTYEYPSGTNVVRDTKIIEQEIPSWVKSDKDQVIDGVLLIGLTGYGAYAKHLYTYTWADEQIYNKRTEQILHSGQPNKWAVFLWRIKCKVRNPKWIAFLDKHRGSLIERVYTFCAYDLLDNGPMYFLKRLWKKVFGNSEQ